MRRLIGLTLADFENREAERERMVSLLDKGEVEFFHIRKPSWSESRMRLFLETFPRRLYSRLCLQDCTQLAVEYEVGGVHLNSRNGFCVPIGFAGRVSTGCHSIAEAAEWKERTDYHFLSPVFDSISKHGYKSAFTLEELEEAFRKGVLDERTVALSGVSRENLPLLEQVGFSSAAIMGDIWRN